ncbi:MAG: NosD domain-containing protein, partial [Candidatus Kariarchaeaceae archaeon]
RPPSHLLTPKLTITNTLLLSFLIFSLVFSLSRTMGAETTQPDVELSLKEGMQDLNFQYVTHMPILIEDEQGMDAFVEQEDLLGDGSLSDPYILEGYSITTSDSNAISISGLSADFHFIIRNCLINVSSEDGVGIEVKNVSEGIVGIDNNLIVNASVGIDIVNANSTRLVNNYCLNSGDYGIKVTNSDYSYLENNTCKYSKQGIVIDSSNYMSIHNNRLIKNSVNGLNVTDSNHGTIRWNFFAENDLGMEISGTNNTMTFNIFNLNTQNPQAADYGTNHWNLSIGNYWSDYSGTGDYTFKIGAQDFHPMTIAQLDSDLDNDGIIDGWELTYHLDIFNATDAQGDLDSDGLNNLDEFLNETDPTNKDSDGDGMNDGDEVKYGYDPLNDSSNQQRSDTIVLVIMMVLFFFIIAITMLFAEYQAR